MNISTEKLKTEIAVSDVAIAGLPAIAVTTEFVRLVQSFSWCGLSEVSHSTLSRLQGYYGRMIMNELGQPCPRQNRIKAWHYEIGKLATIKQDSANFMTRKRMEEIIITYSPILKATS